MKTRLLFALCLTTTITYSQNNTYKPKHDVMLNAVHGERIQEQCSRDFPKGVDSFFTPSKEQVGLLYSNFKQIVKPGLIEHLSILKRYAYQYIGIFSRDTAYLYVNAFTINDMKRDLGWEKYPVMACDGGEQYWGVLFSLKTKTFSQLAINGGYKSN